MLIDVRVAALTGLRAGIVHGGQVAGRRGLLRRGKTLDAADVGDELPSLTRGRAVRIFERGHPRELDTVLDEVVDLTVT
jgi:hypothetical protein